MEIVLATRNKKKVEEIRRITADLKVTILSLDDVGDCPETVEDCETFEGNAVKKATEVSACTGKIALSDDSGLVVDALNGAPGVYSARYAGEVGQGADAKNNAKLLSELAGVAAEKRVARFVCCIALAYPNGSVETFCGQAEGAIGTDLKGATGFGYDPLFIPTGEARTFAEMSGAEKDRLSHRGKALEKLAEYLRSRSHLEN